MSACWCGSHIDPDGNHLDIPESHNPWGGSYFRHADGKLIHEKEKPARR